MAPTGKVLSPSRTQYLLINTVFYFFLTEHSRPRPPLLHLTIDLYPINWYTLQNTRFFTSIGVGILVGLILSERKFSVRLENGQGIFALTSDELGPQDFGGGRRMYPAPPPFPIRMGPGGSAGNMGGGPQAPPQYWAIIGGGLQNKSWWCCIHNPRWFNPCVMYWHEWYLSPTFPHARF